MSGNEQLRRERLGIVAQRVTASHQHQELNTVGPSNLDKLKNQLYTQSLGLLGLGNWNDLASTAIRGPFYPERPVIVA